MVFHSVSRTAEVLVNKRFSGYISVHAVSLKPVPTVPIWCPLGTGPDTQTRSPGVGKHRGRAGCNRPDPKAKEVLYMDTTRTESRTYQSLDPDRCRREVISW